MNRLMALALLAANACGGPVSKKAEAPPVLPAAPVLEALMQWQGAFCGVDQPGARVVEDAEQWKKLWKDIGAQDPGAPDFKTHYAVAVFLGQRNTGGYSARLTDPVVEDGVAVVRYKVVAPRGLVIQAITQPYHVRAYPRDGHPVRLEALPE